MTTFILFLYLAGQVYIIPGYEDRRACNDAGSETVDYFIMKGGPQEPKSFHICTPGPIKKD